MMPLRRNPSAVDTAPSTPLVGLEPQTLADLTDHITRLHTDLHLVLPAQITDAIQHAVVAAASDPTTWAAAVRGIRAATEHHAGRLVFGALWGVVRRTLAIIAVGMLVYSVGGWTALAGLFKAASTGGGAP